MKRQAVMILVVCLWVVSSAITSFSQEDIEIWKEFVDSLKKGTLTLDQIRSEYTDRETQLKWLRDLRQVTEEQGTWSDWEETPEIFPVENRVHFLVRFRMGDKKQTRCFSFLEENGRWFYTHMEMIFLRLDKISTLPTSQFPDYPEDKKAWMREETYWSMIILNLYVPLSREKGKDFVFNLLKDGGGYFVAAKTWVPFVPPRRAFILWLCWEQAVLRGNLVKLEKLNDQEALVRMQAHFFWLYKRTSHLRTQIPFDDYCRIFETIWQDRAANAGWKLEISYSDKECLECLFRFTRKESQDDNARS